MDANGRAASAFREADSILEVTATIDRVGNNECDGEFVSLSKQIVVQDRTHPTSSMEGGVMAKTRLQFDFSPEALSELDELKDSTGAQNRAEVIRQALRLLQWTVEQTRDEDATVIIEKNGRQREVIFPFLSSAKATANGK